MLKRFLDGLVFGAGFSVAFAIVWIAVWMFLMPTLLTSGTNVLPEPIVFDGDDAAGVPQSAFNEFQDFHEMSVDDQIAAASVIVLIEFEAADDGRMKAVISEILKETEGADFSYAVGDEYHSHSYYPGDRYSKEREVIFFTGTPARMRYSTTYTGDRITGLNNMPLELFLEKCAEAAESSETT